MLFRSFHDSAKDIILEWLNSFSAKTEDDLLLVVTFLEDQIEKLTLKYENTMDLNWYINRMVENFRNSDSAVKTIPEIGTIIKLVD